MAEFVNKHSFKIQLSAMIALLAFVIYWTFTSAGYIYAVDSNSERITKLENKFEQLATKADLLTLKQDLKDYISK